jgi:hypothetical protein
MKNLKDIESHKTAAKHLEEAAKHHREAAKHLEEGNPDKAHYSLLKALAHTEYAAKIHKEHLMAWI